MPNCYALQWISGNNVYVYSFVLARMTAMHTDTVAFVDQAKYDALTFRPALLRQNTTALETHNFLQVTNQVEMQMHANLHKQAVDVCAPQNLRFEFLTNFDDLPLMPIH